MEELKIWWQIAQIAGAGAAVVLGPVALLLWRKMLDDQKYHREHYDAQEAYLREADKSTLKVLSELTHLLQADGKDMSVKHQQVLDAIARSVETLKTHVDARIGLTRT